MQIFQHTLIFTSGFMTILVMDSIWLGIILKQFIIKEFGPLVSVTNGSIDIKLHHGFIAWSAIVLLVMLFVTYSGKVTNPLSALMWGGIMGGALYMVYDFTNLTFLKNYSLTFSLVDVVWGMLICACVSLNMYLVSQLLSKYF